MREEIIHLKKWGRRATAAFCLIVICVAGGFWIITKKADERAEKGTYGNCHRLNIVRAIDNENDYSNYLFFKSVLVLLDNALKAKPSVTKEEMKTDNSFLIPLNNIVNKEKWIPLTNCEQAVYHPYTYIPPEPIEFSKYTPSKYAFELGSDN